MKAATSRDLSMRFYDKEIESQARYSGRHYLVGHDGRLLKLMSAESTSQFVIAEDEENLIAQSARSRKITKIIYPTSSIRAINRFMCDTGRYIQRNNNTSMSIRDYVEAKGQVKSEREVIPKQKSMDIRMSFY
jgi:hypothetical protein